MESSQTSVTLLQRLARGGLRDDEAWTRFADHYGPRIHAWCLRWQLQPADADDVTQVVLAKLVGQMREFVYDPAKSFRGWLKTVAHNAWRDMVKCRRQGDQPQGGSAVFFLLDSVEAREDLVQRLESEFDQELLEQAMRIVQEQVSPENWRAFCLTALEDVPAAEVARQLNMKIARVYAARSHIQQRLRDLCRELDK